MFQKLSDSCVASSAYFDNFPPKGTNVSVVIRELTPGQGNRHILVADKEFTAGEVIYKVGKRLYLDCVI